MVNWAKLRQDFENVFWVDVLRVNPEQTQAMVIEGNSPVAIFRVREGGGLNLHLRASLSPGVAAIIGAITVYTHQFDVCEVFEFNEDGSFIFGDDALKFFVSNADKLHRPPPKEWTRSSVSVKLN